MTGVLRRAIARSLLPSSSSSSAFSFTGLASAGMSTWARSGDDEAMVVGADPSSSTPPPPASSKQRFEWCVVGAGPAGIAAVGLLLDSSVPPASIAWVDPEFRVGDFGTKWRHVSSNTTVGLFLRFYRSCESFEFEFAAADGSACRGAASGPKKKKKAYAIESIPEKHTCVLEAAAEPLRDITATLRSKVASFRARVEHLKERNAAWECALSNGGGGGMEEGPGSISAANVVLATGAEPRPLSFHTSAGGPEVIPLADALDPGRLAASVAAADTVAVFGSSHSAVMIVRQLLERTAAAGVLNFYRDPLRYALYTGDDWILFDDTGLKGDTARWSREHLHGDLPPRLRRAYSDDASIAALLPACTKVIYATGFERRPIPRGVRGLAPAFSYNPHCGIIAPGLFGCGIGYPEQRTDRYGNVELRVGLWKFMDYLRRVLPLWQQYSVSQGIGQPKGAPGTPSAPPPPPPTTASDGI